MKIFFFFLFALPLFATVNEPFRWELFSGYRNDRVHWHLQTPGEGTLTYSELYRDIQFWENGLAIKTISHDLLFFASGSYGAFGRGSLFQRYANLSFTSLEPNFSGSTTGWAADTKGIFGYTVNLTADRTYKVILLVPLFGYSAHFERLNRKGISPNPFTSSNAVGASSFSMQSSLPNQLHLTWFGFFFGGGFQIEPGGRLSFSAGYTYHFLSTRFSSHFKREVSLFNPDLISASSTSTKIKAKNGGIGQTGWAFFDYIVDLAWKVGLGAQIHYFSSSVISVKERTDSASTFPSVSSSSLQTEEKFKLRWTSVSGWLQVSRVF